MGPCIKIKGENKLYCILLLQNVTVVSKNNDLKIL